MVNLSFYKRVLNKQNSLKFQNQYKKIKISSHSRSLKMSIIVSKYRVERKKKNVIEKDLRNIILIFKLFDNKDKKSETNIEYFFSSFKFLFGF